MFAILAADGAILGVYRCDARFNVFHVGSIVNVVIIGLAIRPMPAGRVRVSGGSGTAWRNKPEPLPA